MVFHTKSQPGPSDDTDECYIDGDDDDDDDEEDDDDDDDDGDENYIEDEEKWRV